MSHDSLADVLNRLDELVRRHWQMSLFAPTGQGHVEGNDLQYLLDRLPEAGFDLNIGANSFELVGRRRLETIQYQFADRDPVVEVSGTVFITQQDFNAVYVEHRGRGAVWGGLVGDEFQCFGLSLAAFFACLADCFEIAHREGEGLDEAKLNEIREAVGRNEGASVDGWLEYFYG